MPLETLATNLWWTDHAEAEALFRSIHPGLWERSRHNPVALLPHAEPEHVEHAAELVGQMAAELAEPGWCDDVEGMNDTTIAYFSMEFGLHQSLRIYSGGLGVLAGDHLRSASDLGVPLIAVGLLYREGYFRQVFEDGEQTESYPRARFDRLPVRPVVDDDETPIEVEVPIGEDTVKVRAWSLAVGRVALVLLDTDLDENSAAARALTARLYGGDETMRIRQEVLLGIGGLKFLRAMGNDPDLLHLNEGHCAFAPLVLWSESSPEEARERCVFTTHTPVPAGHDRFSAELVRAELGPWCKSAGLDVEAVIGLGRVDPKDEDETCCMTVIGIRLSRSTNGVAALHGVVSRTMWSELWPDRPVDEVPIGHITNGVHPVFWSAPATRAFYDDRVPGWRQRTWDPEVWRAIEDVSDEALWLLRNRLRLRLLTEVEHRTGVALDPTALTIGFARRFAPYKRGDLIFSDPDRLEQILDRGVQLIYAGKAHPRDDAGKRLVANVLDWSERFPGQVVLLEDYDIRLGGLLTSGADVWLNNPRRPREASGTSGQKVIFNGGLNLSVLDGWWPEGFDGTNGFSIGDGEEWEDQAAHDAHDALDLYRKLEQEVLPLWEDRGPLGVPHAWLQRVKRSIATCAPKFSSHRMVKDYVEQVYLK